MKKETYNKPPWLCINTVREAFGLPQYQRKDSCRIIIDSKNNVVAEMRFGYVDGNASLITAAPYMLEALLAIRDRDLDDPEGYDKAFNLVIKAIEKATSKAPKTFKNFVPSDDTQERSDRSAADSERIAAMKEEK